MWPISLSARLPIADLVGRCPANYLMGREPLLQRISPLTPPRCRAVVSCGISDSFPSLSPSEGQIAHALLTRSPLSREPKSPAPFDLHVLGTPPAFVLSQDQTLEFNLQQTVSGLPLTSLLRLRCLPASPLSGFRGPFCFRSLYSSQGPSLSPRDSFFILLAEPSLIKTCVSGYFLLFACFS